MIQPQHLHYESCPDCGAPWHQLGKNTTYDGNIHKHVNGGIWEYIVFTCGRKDEFSPNFDSIETERPCKNTPEMKIRREKRELALTAIIDLIRKSDVDDSFRDRLTRDYKYLTGE